MDSVTRYINHISRLAALYREKEFRKYDLGPMHHTYILNICRNPGISQEELAQMIFVNKSNVARQLAVLEERGFIYRKTSSSDARKQLVYPTQKAEEIRPIISQTLKAYNDELLADFPKERQAELVEDLMKLQKKSVQLLAKKAEGTAEQELKKEDGTT